MVRQRPLRYSVVCSFTSIDLLRRNEDLSALGSTCPKIVVLEHVEERAEAQRKVEERKPIAFHWVFSGTGAIPYSQQGFLGGTSLGDLHLVDNYRSLVNGTPFIASGSSHVALLKQDTGDLMARLLLGAPSITSFEL